MSHDSKDLAVAWAASRWTAEVANRPVQNVHRRALDTTWRQVIRHFGGDDVALCGAPHDELLSSTTERVEDIPKAIPNSGMRAEKPAPDAMRLTDRELYDHSCITRHQLENWVDSDYASHIGGLKHTIEFLLGRLDSLSAPAPSPDVAASDAPELCQYCGNPAEHGVFHCRCTGAGEQVSSGKIAKVLRATPSDDVRSALADLPLLWECRANALRILDSKRDVSDDSTLGEADGLIEAAKELRAALRSAPVSAPVQSAIDLIDDYDRHGSIDHGIAFELKRKLSSLAVPAVGVTREAIQEACDLLAERKHGNPARSPGHNARLLLESLLRPPVLDATVSAREAVPVDEWRIVPEQPVLIYVVHPNAAYERNEVKRLADWEGWFSGRWIKHNSGGWTWHGMIGTVTHVAPLPAVPAIRSLASGAAKP